MLKYLTFWKKPKQITAPTNAETISNVLLKTNEMFKIFLNNCSWFVYLLASLLILCCIYYYIYDCKRRLDLRRRREDFQRGNERIPQRRRPGAVHRDHEIFRNAIKTVHRYIEPYEKQGSAGRSYVLKRTRSGAIYGSFCVNEVNS
ncbi:uncharacterized protein LOC111683364 [Lucilia cuprina]|uniref:uncharacterized protein LOC111683364 n=1 Tax=Lucilia cuprina TaxID=7375 RepID=UPI001F053A38|nr:uncharacterized protein LOC111683364 [Lucilia cuprina]